MKKKVLVAGGAGFLGSHLCEKLLEQGHDVTCLDNFFTGSYENIHHLRTHPAFKTVHHDICFPFYTQADQIYNLACPASPVHYQIDPVMTTKTSVMGAINLLELAKRAGATILQASTSEVYGDPLQHPQKESYFGNVNPIGPRSCYDVGKRCAETLFFDYKRQHGLSIKIARIFNTYGPKTHPQDGRVVSNFIVQALTQQPLTLFGDGQQTRSFCYVDDLIEGLMALMESPNEEGPINLGNPKETSMRELGELIINLTQSTSTFTTLPLPHDDPKKRKPDISLAKERLEWEPKIDLKEGLLNTIAYFKKKMDEGEGAFAAQHGAVLKQKIDFTG